MASVRKNLRYFIVLIIIIVLCIIIVTVSFRNSDVLIKARSATIDAFRPVQEKTYQFFQPLIRFFNNIRDYFVLSERIKSLEQQNRKLTKDYSESINLKIENDALRRLIGMKLRQDYKTEPAKVIGFYENKWQSQIIINAGRSSGILEGMAVVNEDGLIGIVSLASNNTSEVRLINDPQSSIGARILSSRKLGMVEGSSDKTIYLNYISSDNIVFKGDILITSEFGELIPSEILIGRIKKIKEPEKTPYLQIEVEPFADFKRLEYVLVIKN
ncbi:MAG: rod shape-determining protein MreC [Actinobacteria bacterium]|nr:rod shape-determining protein MreC [Actinomycetota bacterium]MBM3712224.1 rod shape-determining protein MreC [Actinomycetota bacterium]